MIKILTCALVVIIFLICPFVLADNSRLNYSIMDKIEEAKILLQDLKLDHSGKLDTYEQSLVFGNNNPVIRYYRDFTWKELALAILDLKTGNISVIKIRQQIEVTENNRIKIKTKTKSGKTEIRWVAKKKKEAILENQNKNFEIEIEKRLSGLAWNQFNTPFVVKNPSGKIVIANKYPMPRGLDLAGKLKTKEIIYSSYNSSLHIKEVVSYGNEYFDKILSEVDSELKRKNVFSRAFPAKLVANLIPSLFIKRTILAEHIDFDEFKNVKVPQKLVERVLIILGSNKKEAYSYTSSPKNAQGFAQFIKSTYDFIEKSYPEAELDPRFLSGAVDHLNSLKAAYLLYDYNLAKLIQSFGESILEDPSLEEYLAAAYNGGVGRVISAIKKSKNKGLKILNVLNSSQFFKLETIGYLEKIYFLKTISLP